MNQKIIKIIDDVDAMKTMFKSQNKITSDILTTLSRHEQKIRELEKKMSLLVRTLEDDFDSFEAPFGSN